MSRASRAIVAPSVHNVTGFTLIEILVVTVIIGILIAIAIPRFSNTKENALDAAAKSDLHNAMNAQEAYFAENQTYSAAVSNLELTTSTGVSLGGGGSVGGYSMTSRHASSAITFRVTVGSGASTDGKIQ